MCIALSLEVVGKGIREYFLEFCCSHREVVVLVWFKFPFPPNKSLPGELQAELGIQKWFGAFLTSACAQPWWEREEISPGMILEGNKWPFI